MKKILLSISLFMVLVIAISTMSFTNDPKTTTSDVHSLTKNYVAQKVVIPVAVPYQASKFVPHLPSKDNPEYDPNWCIKPLYACVSNYYWFINTGGYNYQNYYYYYYQSIPDSDAPLNVCTFGGGGMEICAVRAFPKTVAGDVYPDFNNVREIRWVMPQ